MDNKTLKLSVIMPALNEESNIIPAIKNTLDDLDKLQIKGEIIVINDGSKDNTPNLVSDFTRQDNRVSMLTHSSPQGIGASFWDGVDKAKGDIVVMLPGDGENDPAEILRYLKLLDDVDMVIPFVFNKAVRSFSRKILSSTFIFIINNTFQINLNYTNGTVLYRKSLLKELGYRGRGFFYQTDILIRLIKKGYLYTEVPYKLNIRKQGKSKAVTINSLSEVVKGYFRLIRDIYLRKPKQQPFGQDTVSAQRNK